MRRPASFERKLRTMKKLIYLLVLCLCLNGTALVLAESGGAKVTSTTSEKAGKEAAAKKKATGSRRLFGSVFPGRTAMVRAEISAVLQMTDPMALP